MLERLVRRQRPPEAPPVREPLEGDGEAGVHRARGLGDLDEEREVELAFDLSRHVRQDAVGIEHHLVEDDLHVLPGEVDRPHGTDLDARCRRPQQVLHRLASASPRVTRSQSTSARGVRDDTAAEAPVAHSAAHVELRRGVEQERPVVRAPRGQRLPRAQRVDDVAPSVGRAVQERVDDDVGPDERHRRQLVSCFVRQHRERFGRTGVGVVEQQGGEPTDLGALAPPLERERVVGLDDGPQLRARDRGREETPRGVAEELLLRGQVPDHGPSCVSRPAPIGALLWW